MSTLERIWLAYVIAVLAVAATAVAGAGGGQGRPIPFVLVHLGVAAAWLLCARAETRLSPTAMRWLRALLACGCLPVVFSALAWLLPDVHPEPYEYAWYRLDLALLGGDVTQGLFAALPPWAVPPLQLVYASFYLLPIGAGLTVGAVRGGPAFDRAMTILVGGFLASYLGYQLFPTLAPKVVFAAGGTVGGDGFAGLVHGMIDRAELNRWDCFPSGHTMLALISVLVVWRWARRWTPLFVLLAVPLIGSTVLLRYHWPIDVLAGAAASWPAARVCDWLLDRDGASPA